MKPSDCRFMPAFLASIVLGFLAALSTQAAVVPDQPAKKSFDVPAGNAPVSLKQFAQQSGLELLYSVKDIEGTKTNAVKGLFTPREALVKMLSGTKLIATPGKVSGAFAVTRAPDPNG
jgi:hypothetical protein